LVTTGGIDYGDPPSVQPIIDALVSMSVPHEIVPPLQAARRWPGFIFDGPVLYQPDGGRLYADRVVHALQERAEAHGARLRFEEPVRVLEPRSDDRIMVTTDVEQYRAKRAVVTTGAWISTLLAGLVDLPPLTVTREQVFHFPSRIG